MKTLTAIFAVAALTGCSLLGGQRRPNRDLDQEDGAVNQVGLVNVNSGNTYNFPPPAKQETRFSIDQRLRLDRQGR